MTFSIKDFFSNFACDSHLTQSEYNVKNNIRLADLQVFRKSIFLRYLKGRNFGGKKF